jgi:very-short-patch-repair endonuclease
MLQYGRHLKKYSRRIRKEMTEAERVLWSRIRGKQLKGRQVYRQKPIGRFVVDFYCPKAKLVIELDGDQHYTESCRQGMNERQIYDDPRTKDSTIFGQRGFRESDRSA